MKEFSFIKVENKKYPVVIMGEDKFTGWWKGQKKYSEEERAVAYRETLRVAYSNGVRGFSMSPNITLLRVLRQFKKEHPDIICIANPHWQNHYYIVEESLWTENNLKRLGATQLYFNQELERCRWYDGLSTEERFSDEEIGLIRLDEEEYKRSLKEFDFCDFWLVGNIGSSAFVLLDRIDIVKREVELVREFGMIPIGMCQGGGLALLVYEKMDVAGTWVWINKGDACPNLSYALEIIRGAKKPITAYRVFSDSGGFDLEGSISFVKDIGQIKSVVVGVENKEQAKETFSQLKKFWA